MAVGEAGGRGASSQIKLALELRCGAVPALGIKASTQRCTTSDAASATTPHPILRVSIDPPDTNTCASQLQTQAALENSFSDELVI